MKRRDALKRLAVLSAGVTLLPGCAKEDTIFGESQKVLNITDDSAEFIDQLAHVILPIKDDKFNTPETLSEFITTMMNDCHSPTEVENFGLGYKEYKAFLNNTFTNDIDGLSSNEISELFKALENEETMSGNAKYFFNKLRQLRVKHFTTSPHYVTAYEHYEMVPARYNGCVTLEERAKKISSLQ